MSTSRINLQLAHDKLGSFARDAITLEKAISKQHPELYAQISHDLDQVISRIYSIRNDMRRYDYKLTYKSIFK